MAIIRGTSTVLGNLGGGPQSFTGPTVTGSNTYGVFWGFSRGNPITSVTWGGSAMTQVTAGQQGPAADSGDFVSLWIIAAPSSAATIVVDGSGTTIVAGIAGYYMGVQQTGQPNVSTTNSGTSVTSLTTSVTTTVDECVTVLVARTSTGGTSAGTGSSLIDSSLCEAYDSGSPLNPGSNSMQVTNASGNTFTVMAALIPVTTLTGDLQGYWKFDESSGNATDSSGNNNTLTNNGSIAYGVGKRNNAADLEASSSNYFEISDASQTGLDITGDMSINFWVKMESQPADGSLMTFANKYDNGIPSRSWVFSYGNTGGTFYLEWANNDGTNAAGSINQTLNNGTWYMLSAIYDASAGSTEIYVDSSSIGTIGSLRTSMNNSTAPFRIGSFRNSDPINTFFTDGMVDEFRIWSRLITSTEITELYDGGEGLSTTTSSSTSTSTSTTTSTSTSTTTSSTSSTTTGAPTTTSTSTSTTTSSTTSSSSTTTGAPTTTSSSTSTSSSTTTSTSTSSSSTTTAFVNPQQKPEMEIFPIIPILEIKRTYRATS